MDIHEALALVFAFFGIGSLFGYAAGRLVERDSWKRARRRRTFRRSYHVSAPSGLFIDTPDIDRAEEFAGRYGGIVTVRPSK